MRSRDRKIAFNEKPLTLNDDLDSVGALQLTQDDTVKKIVHNEHDELGLKR